MTRPLTAAALLLLAFSAAAEPKIGADGALELGWDDLVPQEFSLEQLVEGLGINDISDEDPRAAEKLDQLRSMWNAAPTVAELDGRQVRLPGFVVPLEGDGQVVSEFLLVPYLGACIHVPPPPANQMVFVTTGKEGAAVRHLFDTVQVTGRLDIERTASDMGDAGYVLKASKVEPYEP